MIHSQCHFDHVVQILDKVFQSNVHNCYKTDSAPIHLRECGKTHTLSKAVWYMYVQIAKSKGRKNSGLEKVKEAQYILWPSRLSKLNRVVWPIPPKWCLDEWPWHLGECGTEGFVVAILLLLKLFSPPTVQLAASMLQILMTRKKCWHLNHLPSGGLWQ